VTRAASRVGNAALRRVRGDRNNEKFGCSAHLFVQNEGEKSVVLLLLDYYFQ
jgi:hypothetical protein